MDIRELVAVANLATLRSFKLAASHLHITQPTLSRLISKLESELGVTLFNRGWSGAETTVEGDTATLYAQSLMIIIGESERSLFAGRANHPPLAGNLTLAQLEVIDAIRRTGGATSAARDLGCRQPAVSRVLNELKSHFGLHLFERSQGGLAPLPAAAELVSLYHKILALFADLRGDLERQRGQLAGRIAIGVLPFSGQNLLAKVFARITDRHPRVRLALVPGTYFGLVDSLRRGEIEGFVGIMRSSTCPIDLIETPLLREEYTIVARRDHPAQAKARSIEDLRDEAWIIPPQGSPVRAYFERVFREAKCTPRMQTCEIQFFGAVEQILADSNAIGMQTYSRSQLENLRKDLCKIDIPLPLEPVPIALTTLRGMIEDPVFAEFKRLLLEMAPEFD